MTNVYLNEDIQNAKLSFSGQSLSVRCLLCIYLYLGRLIASKFYGFFMYFLFFLQNQMIMQDRLEKERCDAKNAVEEYVYDMRDKLCGPYEQFCQEEVTQLGSILLLLVADELTSLIN